MDILSSAILGGVIWDGIKFGGTLTVDHLKKSLKKWLLKDEEYEAIVKTINEAQSEYKRTDKFITAFVDDNKEICKIIERINSDNKNEATVNQTIYENKGNVFGTVNGNININGEQNLEKKL
ncbi:hypothetical protein [Clostridium diolis]|uniref:hypothetical protein n=1 Tax=Clostridium diolis TaxID=223919 RepID=UPI003AF484A8